MQTYKKYYLEFIKKIEYIVPLLITLIACFGFAITHTSVSIDDTACSRYIDEYGLISQGRFTATFLDNIFKVIRYQPFLGDFIAVVLLTMAVILFCTLFKKISNDKLHPICYTIFSCVFVSYPLISEIFNYEVTNIIVGLEYLLVAFSLITAYEGLKNKKIIPLILSSLIMCINVSAYESCAPIYIFGVFAIFILEFLFNDEKSKKLKDIIINGLKYSIPLAVGIVLELVLSKVILLFVNVTLTPGRENTIVWGTKSILSTLKYLIRGIGTDFVIASLYYLPITVLAISTIICVVMLLTLAIKNKSITIAFLFSGMIGSLLAVSVLVGKVSPYRTCQVFAVFISFIFMLLWHFISTLKKSHITDIVKYTTLCLMFILIVRQSNDLNKMFTTEYDRSCEETRIVNQVGYELQSKFNIQNKPVVFVGGITLSDNVMQNISLKKNTAVGEFVAKIYKKLTLEEHLDNNPKCNFYLKFTQTNCLSLINWGNWAFNEVNTETLTYFKMNGYYFNQATPKMKLVAEEYVKKENTPNWPKEGSIFEMDDCIVVNF